MTDEPTKLSKDVAILERFASEMDAYLRSDAIFWPTGPNMPRLTLGSYLMRQHRLLVLRDLLSQDEQNRVDNAVDQYHTLTAQMIVATENKAHAELGPRYRQWIESIRELQNQSGNISGYYATAVDNRVILAALIRMLSLPPYRIDSDIPSRLEVIDVSLRNRWNKDDFVWPEQWQLAYPIEEFWYLYGYPR